MRAIRESLVSFGESAGPMIEVLGEDGAPARTLSYQEVTRRAADLAGRIGHGDGRPLRIGVVCGNTPEFVVADLALIVARAIEVPVPLAFSAEQAAGLLEETDLCLADAAGQERLTQWGRGRVLRPDCTVLPLSTDEPVPSAPLVLAPAGVAEADWECKVIHTSGTTSRPKGVRIRAAALNELLGSLRSVMPRGAFARYLSVVPFSLLIEQVTGLYMVLLDGGTLVLMPPGKALVGTAAAAAADAMPYVAAAPSHPSVTCVGSFRGICPTSVVCGGC
ncbi:AMP-binding protein, partial [Streptomyces decoyicus]|uniref:AMP-binding protein n=1 Tax=Streptomyces decoyicus TaxID=249567 RepID=UPI0033A2EF77